MATPKTDKEIISVAVTPEQLAQLSNRSMGLKDNKRKELVRRYMAEEKVPVSISPFYAPHLGSVVNVSVQGISVFVPADGQTYRIPRTHAGWLFNSIAQIDLRQRKLARMSNIKENLEPSIGALRF
jgi:hypothetical protein